jgi:flavin reductase (DIM6/NTAB) family NADH-FMN oxidoreductase RutF
MLIVRSVRRSDESGLCHLANLNGEVEATGREMWPVDLAKRGEGSNDPNSRGATAQHREIAPNILYFGTPVVLISTCNEDRSPNLAPMSSAWALGHTIMLGLGAAGKTAANLARSGECVLNLPSADLWQAVEKLAPLTGKNPLPDYKLASGFRYERDKFGAAGLTPVPSEVVEPPRVAECPLQLEVLVRDIRSLCDPQSKALAVEVEVVCVHAHAVIIEGERHISPTGWQPLIYSFRHYFGLGIELGKTFRAEI